MKSSEYTPMRRQQFRLKSKYASRRNLNKYFVILFTESKGFITEKVA